MGSTTYLLFLSVTPQDEWRLHDLPEVKPDRLNSRERKLTQQFPEVWAEDNLPRPQGLVELTLSLDCLACLVSLPGDCATSTHLEGLPR